jgi:hypothetical protein
LGLVAGRRLHPENFAGAGEYDKNGENLKQSRHPYPLENRV